MAIAAMSCGGKKPSSTEPIRAKAQALTTGPSFTLELPPNLTAGGAGLTSKGGVLQVGDRVQVKQPNGAFAGVVSLTDSTALSPDAKTGDLWSKGSVDLRDRAEVHGYLKTAGTLTRGLNTIITGQIQSGTPLTDPTLPTVTVQFMDGAADFTVANDQTVSMNPGDYGSVIVRARGTLNIAAGEYRFLNLTGEPGATIRADTSGGEVRIFVRQGLSWQASLTFAAGNPGKVLLGYVGTTATFVTAPFNGTFLVPNAQLTLATLAAGYSGAFFGKGLIVQPDVTVTTQAFRPPCEGVNPDDGNSCTTDACDPVTGAVTHTPVANGTACNDGNACTQTDTCQSGTCTGSNPVVCTALDQCHTAGTCNTSTGACSNPTKANGTGCNDGNACTRTDTCQSGTCTGGNPVVCTALDQCHTAGTCNTSTGACSNPTKANGTACNDSNACTQTDTCQSGTCTGSNPVVCTALDQCHTVGTCNTSTGACSNPTKANGTACSDGNACTQTDTCQSGTCTGSSPVVCTALDQCHTAGTCNTSTGACSNPTKANGTACNDSNACTQTDTCQSGTCTGSNPVVCTALDQCHTVGTCNTSTGACSNPTKANGTACDDGNACTQTDTCQSGACAGSNPVACTAQDQCHTAGACNPSTGVCSTPTKADGTACNDGNACTQTDTCQGGTCTGGNAVVCAALDQCHAPGTCDASTGLCSNPAKADGTACNDGNACTQTDTCQGGTCTGGNAVVCAPPDQCHSAGVCEPTTGACTSAAKPDGTVCNDGNACTQTDTCQSGSCTGSNPVTCAAASQCQAAGACDPSTGVCSNVNKPDGTACDDGDKCTTGESCQAGACGGGVATVISDLNPCTTDSCDPVLGVLHTPVPAGTPCDDGNACNGVDTCDASGACVSGTPPSLDDGNPCTIDACDPIAGVTHTAAPLGAPCDDSTVCNGRESCDATGHCLAGTPPVLDDGNPCTTDTCDPASGVAHTVKPAGASCDDLNVCNGRETCDGAGLCIPGTALVVDDGNPCSADRCDPIFGVMHTDVPVGLPCSDGNPCNGLEMCDGHGTCLPGVAPQVDDANPCTVDSCDSVLGVQHVSAAIGTLCSDGNACNGTETCNGSGACVPGVAPSVDDGNACTVDSCDPVAGVTHTPIVVPDDGNPCTIKRCDPASGLVVESAPALTSCFDGNACNGSEICDGHGTCLPGLPVSIDDGNPCTDDFCDPGTGKPVHVNRPVNEPCNVSGDLCAPGGTCDATGSCILTSPPVVVSDQNPCTSDVCDPATGQVQHIPEPVGTSCDNGNACDGTADTCDSTGTCTGAGTVAVDDGDPCTVDFCDPTLGVTHSPAPVGTDCAPGLACDVNGHCTNQPATDCAAYCQAQVNCSTDSPDTHYAQCVQVCSVLKENLCADKWRTFLTCAQQSRVSCGTGFEEGLKTRTSGAEFLDCVAEYADFSACHAACDTLSDPFLAGTGGSGSYLPVDPGCANPVCVNNQYVNWQPAPYGTPCGSEHAGHYHFYGCAPTTVCSGSGQCIPTGPYLPDYTPCMTPFGQGFCSTGQCNVDERWADACTLGVGDRAGETGAWHVPEGTPCQPLAADLLDNAGDWRRSCYSPGRCDAFGLCIATPLPSGTSCGGACGLEGVCTDDGHCREELQQAFDDQNPCTADSCDASTGFQIRHVPTPGASCDDGNPCNGSGETCNEAGVCIAATPPIAVDDGNPCTDDICDELDGTVYHFPTWAGTPCPDSNPCNGTETCDGHGNCIAGTDPVPVDDGNPCTVDSCDPVTGNAVYAAAAAGTSCGNENPCDGAEVCDGAGTCLPGIPSTLDDGNPCTDDACDPATGVTHLPKDVSDGNPCTDDICDPVAGVSHPLRAAGSSCSDGNECNGMETCDANGRCQPGVPSSISDGNPCTLDVCDASTGVAGHPPVRGGTPCSDGNACNGLEVCDGAGTCVAGVAPTIDDGDNCTVDSCDPTLGVLHVSTGVSGCTSIAWTKTEQSAPSPRDSASGIFEPTLQELVLFGGENAGVTLADTWLWHRATATWEKSDARGPTARAGAQMAFDAQRRKGLLFGGVTGAFADARYLSDLWEYDVLSDTWAERPASTGVPPGRVYPAVTFDSARGKMLVFGGHGTSDLGDTWEWDPLGASWTQRTASGPSPRHGAAMAFDPARGKVVLFGGAPELATGVALSDTWEFDPVSAQWNAIPVSNHPSSRTGHGMVFDYGRDAILIHGGTDEDELNLDDTWEYRPEFNTWAPLNGDPRAPALSGQVLVPDPESKRVISAGGLSFSSDGRVTPETSDVWEYDGSADVWTARSSRYAPLLVEPSVAHDRQRNILYFRFNDATSGGDWSRRPGVLWQYDLNTATWSATTETAPNSWDGKLVYDNVGQQLLLIAPTETSTPLFRWGGSSWQSLCTLPGVFNGTVAYDPVRSRILVLGSHVMLNVDATTCAYQQEIPTPFDPTTSSVAWDEDRDVLFLFGGSEATQSIAPNSGVAWQWSPLSRLWTQVVGSGPSPRIGATLTYDRAHHEFLLFGGASGELLTERHSDTWKYVPAQGSWVQMLPEGSMPSGGTALSVFDTRAQQVLLINATAFDAQYCGLGVLGGPFWYWTGDEWIRQSEPSVAPEARSGASGGWHAAAGYGVMFGGTSGDGHRRYLGDMWIWQNGWHLVSIPRESQAPIGYVAGFLSGPEAPSPRTGHALALPIPVQNGTSNGLLFGGEDDNGVHADTWLLTAGFHWHLLDQLPMWPAARAEHALIGIPGGWFIMFGGRGTSGDLNDTWIFGQYGWTKSASSTAPSPRHAHAMALDPDRNTVLLFGGRAGAGALRDTWEYDVAQDTWRKREPKWSPPARFGHQIAYDSTRKRIVLTGGAGDGPADVYGDTWEWRECDNTWVELVTNRGYGARAGHTMFYDPTVGGLVSFGGLKYADGGESAQTFSDTEELVLGDRQPSAVHLFPNGAHCSSASECASALCVDGFCCNNSCTGQCAACDVSGSEGTCTGATGKPHGSRSACGGTGGVCDLQCNGDDLTACHIPAAGVTCRPTGCSNGVMYSGGVCDGNGTCNAGPSTSCEPYTCTQSGCANQCSDTLPCYSADYFCHAVFSFGRCERFAALNSFSLSSQTTNVGTPITASASAIGSNVVYAFSYKDSTGTVSTPCGAPRASPPVCTWTPSQVGSYTVRVEVRAFYSSKSFDDFRELPLTVVP